MKALLAIAAVTPVAAAVALATAAKKPWYAGHEAEVSRAAELSHMSREAVLAYVDGPALSAEDRLTIIRNVTPQMSLYQSEDLFLHQRTPANPSERLEREKKAQDFMLQLCQQQPDLSSCRQGS